MTYGWKLGFGAKWRSSIIWDCFVTVLWNQTCWIDMELMRVHIFRDAFSSQMCRGDLFLN
jgi:hypothetical protein